MNRNRIDALRHSSRKLVRELGIISLDKSLTGPTPQHCHALIEIGNEPGITVSRLAELLLLSVSAASRLVNVLLERDLVEFRDGVDKREKSLYLSFSGKNELKNIDEYSNTKVQNAFKHLSIDEQDEIIGAIEKYARALENGRQLYNNTKILTLSTSRPLRKQIIAMVENIQKNEFQILVKKEINACVLRAEDHFYFNNSSNFWYAVDDEGKVIGCIGLKKIDETNGELKKFFVDKRFRGKGVAQKLVSTLLKAACKHGFKQLWFGTVEKFVSAKQFYTKCGFTRIHENGLPKGFDKCPLDTLFFFGVVANLTIE